MRVAGNATKFISEKNGVSTGKWLTILAAVLLLAFLVYVLVKINQPVATEGAEQLFTVEAGSSGQAVAQKLADEDLIARPLFLELYLSFKGDSNKIQAGTYALSPAMSVREIARRLTRGQTISDAVKLTVIEGWSINEIGQQLSELGVMSPVEFEAAVGTPRAGGAQDFSGEFGFLANLPEGATLEGFLFPDTYFVAHDASAEQVALKLLANFGRKLDEVEREVGRADMDLYEIVTLASIVEREVGRNLKPGTALTDEHREQLQDERRKVASVFLNRLGIGMALESDATISYITGNGSARATLAETKINSPYNTYQNPGLPPGPIANPSLDSIRAVLDPAETDYLYFLTDGEGRAYFAETFEGHQQNRAKYLE